MTRRFVCCCHDHDDDDWWAFSPFRCSPFTIVMIIAKSRPLRSCNDEHTCKIVVMMMTQSVSNNPPCHHTHNHNLRYVELENSLHLCVLSPLLLARPSTLTGGGKNITIVPSTHNNLTAWKEKKSWGEQQKEQNIKPGRRETLAANLAFFISGIVQPACGGKNYIVVIIVIIPFHHFETIVITIFINM